ncbi:hypothetical protein, partial [Burkholderia sp. Tr-20355]|uniref:hypothetical protein n=1 Tax=Burkholderia sp. Tr-20355 TaxID=2703895 RepID=UPI00197ED293
TSCFPAALRFQQQRSEIMNRVSQLVNNFLHYVVATAGLNFRTPRPFLPSLNRTASLPSAPRFRERERGVILCTRRQSRKGFRKKYKVPHAAACGTF